MSVTVCIPCFNQQTTLHRTIASVLAQTVQPLEVIIVDDGSPTKITIPKMPGNLNHVRVIRVTNRGLPNARNVALMHAKGKAFLPLDADDWIDPTYIEKTYPLLGSKADVVLTGIKEHGPNRNQTYSPGYDMSYNLVTPELMLTTHNRFFYCSLFRTETLKKVGGYNGRMVHGFEDWDLWIDLLRRGVQIRAVDEPLLNYDTSNPNSMLSSSMRMRDEIVTEIHRHHSAVL
jgi:glycosyltransferase involved in cell wall biosynthesis